MYIKVKNLKHCSYVFDILLCGYNQSYPGICPNFGKLKNGFINNIKCHY